MLLLAISLFVCLLGSFFFSGSETGFFSWNRLKVAHAAGQGDITARMAMRLINNRGRLLAAVLTGNNIVNVLQALIFAELFLRIDSMTRYNLSRIPSPESWFLTPVVLLFCEIIPKSLYRTYPYKLTMKSVPLLSVCYYAMSPVYWLIGSVARFFGGGRGAVGANVPQGADVREDILLVVTEGAKRGNIFEGADRLVRNTLCMKGMPVEAFALSLDEWKKRRPVYRASQLLSEFGAATGMGVRPGGGGMDAVVAAGVDTGEVVVFNDGADEPAGYVTLLDAAERGVGLATFGALVKPLPRIRAGMEALACLRRMTQDSPRYYAVINDGKVTALLDKMDLYMAAFSKMSVDAAA